MPTPNTALRASSRQSRVISALSSVLVSTSLFATVLAGFEGLAHNTPTVATDSSRAAAARG